MSLSFLVRRQKSIARTIATRPPVTTPITIRIIAAIPSSVSLPRLSILAVYPPRLLVLVSLAIGETSAWISLNPGWGFFGWGS